MWYLDDAERMIQHIVKQSRAVGRSPVACVDSQQIWLHQNAAGSIAGNPKVRN